MLGLRMLKMAARTLASCPVHALMEKLFAVIVCSGVVREAGLESLGWQETRRVLLETSLRQQRAGNPKL